MGRHMVVYSDAMDEALARLVEARAEYGKAVLSAPDAGTRQVELAAPAERCREAQDRAAALAVSSGFVPSLPSLHHFDPTVLTRAAVAGMLETYLARLSEVRVARVASRWPSTA